MAKEACFSPRGLHLGVFHLFAALGQPISVHRHQRQVGYTDFKENAHIERSALRGGHREDGLRDHALQNGFRNTDVLNCVDDIQFRKTFRINSHHVDFRLSAADGRRKALVTLDADQAVRQTADQFQKKSRRDYNASLVENAALNGGVDSDSRIVSSQLQSAIRSFKQNAFQSGNRALGGCCAGDIADRSQKIFFFASDFQKITSLKER